ncbi:MAG: protein kinase [Acidobacteria bacterium]|nr:protein kinase [Acidobacteriota bacterium]
MAFQKWALHLFLVVGWTLAAALVSIQFQVSAQPHQLRFGSIGLEQGLSQSSVMSLLQDHKGFLWVGTQDGLNRFDGLDFKIYRNHPQDPTSLANNFVKVLYEDRQGTLWVGTDGGGLCRFDRKTERFQIFRHDPHNPTSLGADSIWAICEDATGALWVGTYGGGVSRFDPRTQRFTVYKNNPANPTSLPANIVFTCYLDRQQRLWVGTWGGGLCRYDSTSDNFIQVRPPLTDKPGSTPKFIYGIVSDQSDRLWICTGGEGLFRFDPTSEQFKSYRFDPNLPTTVSTDYIFTLFVDRTGLLWVGTRGGGICQYSPASDGFLRIPLKNNSTGPLSNEVIRSFCQDRAGTLWIGTEGEGLFFYDPLAQRFQTLKWTPTGMPETTVKSLYQDYQGTLWVGTRSGLSRIDAQTGQVKTYQNDPRRPTSLSNNSVFAITQDKTGQLWVGTDGGGLGRFDPTQEIFVNYRHDPLNPNSLTSNNISSLVVDHEGMLWVGLNGQGLCRFHPQTAHWTRFRTNPADASTLSSDAVYTLLEDQKGDIWIGTRGGGLCRYNRQTSSFQSFLNQPGNPASLSGNVVLSLFEDQTGILWVGTRGGGLNRFDPATQTFEALRQANGLPNDVIEGILEDSAGQLWLSTNQGICKFDPVKRSFRKYDASDGLQGNEFSQSAVCKGRGGELFFGGTNGITSFFPDQVTENLFVPPIVITNFKKFNQNVSLETSITETDEITIDYTENFITFEFAALSFTNARRNQFAYRLIGFDDHWIPAGTQRSATFTNLDGGTYTFQVKGSNNDGVWNETGASLRIKVLPPPWKRWWAYGLYALISTAGIIGGVQLQLNRVRTQASIREAQLKAEAAEIQARATEAENRRRAQAEAEMKQKNEQLNQKIHELDQANQELIRSQIQADRIFSALAKALPGTVLEGKYRLDEQIGSGGFGTVFRGTHLVLNIPIAIKIFRPSPGNDSTLAVERFRLEGISTARIQHPNAIRVLDSGISSEGIAYLVMELLEGNTLADEMTPGRIFSLKRTVEILHPVCLALAEAHRLGIIHRDIKPANIFLHQTDGVEVVKLLDFGIAKLLEGDTTEAAQKLTLTGGFIGTPIYTAPERFRSDDYDGRADVFSIAVILFEMLCGHHPFVETKNVSLGVILHQLFSTRPEPDKSNPELPPEVVEVILKGLENNPQHRPSARMFADMLLTAASPYFDLVMKTTTIHSPLLDLAELPTEAITNMAPTKKSPQKKTRENISTQQVTDQSKTQED